MPTPMPCHAHSTLSFAPGMTLQHHPHQLRVLPSTSRIRYLPCSFSSSHSITQAPTQTILTSFFFMTPPIPSISCLAYPGPVCEDPLPVANSPVPGGDATLVISSGLPFELCCPRAARIIASLTLLTSLSLASSASQSISSWTCLAAKHCVARPHSKLLSPSPIPVPMPPSLAP